MLLDLRTILLAATCLTWTCSATAQEDAAAPAKDVSRQTLETMRRHVSSLQAVNRPAQGAEQPLKLNETPVLRYSDPGGITTDASVWTWGDSGRPAVLAGVFFLTQEGKEPKWSCELLSLADGPVAVSSAAGWRWMPATSDLEWLVLKDLPGESPRQRLRQMKEIAERYEVTTRENTIKSQLRLMIQPLCRYADEEQSLIDGAIFSFSAGTNPETLLLVECRKADGDPAWQVAFVRFGANVCEAREGEKVVWERPAIERWDAKEAYFSQFGPVEAVFKPASEQ